jgi:hypothetical protein
VLLGVRSVGVVRDREGGTDGDWIESETCRYKNLRGGGRLARFAVGSGGRI